MPSNPAPRNHVPAETTAGIGGRTQQPAAPSLASKPNSRQGQPERASSFTLAWGPTWKLTAVREISQEGSRYAATFGLTTAVTAKATVALLQPVDPLLDWDPFEQDQAVSVVMPRNRPQAMPRTAARTQRQSEWPQAGPQTSASRLLAEIPWADQILLRWVRLTRGVKLADKAEKADLQIASNELPSNSSPLFDFAWLPRQAVVAAQFGRAALQDTGAILHRSWQASSETELAAWLGSASKTHREPAVSLSALRKLPSIARLENQLRVLPAAGLGFSWATHQAFRQSCHSVWQSDAWASLAAPAQPFTALRNLPSVVAISERIRLLPAAGRGLSAAAQDLLVRSCRSAMQPEARADLSWPAQPQR